MSLEDLEKRIDDALAKLEGRLENLDQELEGKVNAALHPEKRMPARVNRSGAFWGLALIVIGVVLLGNHFEWFDWHIPLIPAALIIIGVYLLIENRG